MSKKLLDRFENSASVVYYDVKLMPMGEDVVTEQKYESIADMHRGLPQFSCSHIEDYCNALYFKRDRHGFAYDGYYPAFLLEDILTGCISNQVRITSYNENREPAFGVNESSYVPAYYNKELLRIMHLTFWNWFYTKKLNPQFSLDYGKLAVYKMLKDDDEALRAKRLSALYRDGWNNEWIKNQVEVWFYECGFTRDIYLKPGAKRIKGKEIKVWRRDYM